MTAHSKKVRIGIIGCGAIGSRLAVAIKKDFKRNAVVCGLFDIDQKKAKDLAKKISQPRLVQSSLSALIHHSDFLIEAVTSSETPEIIRQVLSARKNILIMSVGRFFRTPTLSRLAAKNKCVVLIPSGAIAGLDAVKAASLAAIKKITLTTRKPPSSLAQSAYLTQKNIHLSKIKTETILFDGDVENAVKYFPQNINVAASLALASRAEKKIRIRIVTSPEYKVNSHEIEVVGDFGKILSRTDNKPCADNPKTSYLAVLSATQTLKQFFNSIKIGT